MEKNEMYKVPSLLQQLKMSWAEKRNIRFFVKRDDLIHPAVSGNKWRKLKYNLLQANHLGKTGILTFGGAYSNHLLATAHACMTNKLASFAIVRGEELNESSNPILQQCATWGMQFRFISREEYRLKDDYEYLNELKDEFRSFHLVPEGGKNYYGMIGCQEIVSELEQDLDFDTIWLAQGTCTTSLGIATACSAGQKTNVVPVLKGFDAEYEMKTLLSKWGWDSFVEWNVFDSIEIHNQYHFGGYGVTTPELLDFIHDVENEHGLMLDPVYTGKVFFAMMDYYKNNTLTDQTVVFLHTGGLVAGDLLMQKKSR